MALARVHPWLRGSAAGYFRGSRPSNTTLLNLFSDRTNRRSIQGKWPEVGGANRMEEVLAKRIDAATLDSARAYLVEHQFPQLKIIPGGPAECIARAGHDHDVVFPVSADIEKRLFELAVCGQVPDERLAMRVEVHLQHAGL